jgi:pSer/pThr/pTyr-binding forkhead associated (FHA) protein
VSKDSEPRGLVPDDPTNPIGVQTSIPEDPTQIMPAPPGGANATRPGSTPELSPRSGGRNTLTSLSDLERGLDQVVDVHLRSLVGSEGELGDGNVIAASEPRPGEGSARNESPTTPIPASQRDGSHGLVVRGRGPTALLTIVHGLDAGRVFRIQERATIGRSSRAEVPLDSSAVSHEHARIERRNGELWIQDLGSTNGTIVNGKRLTAPLRLTSRDTLVISDITLVLLEGDDAEAAGHTQVLPPMAARTALTPQVWPTTGSMRPGAPQRAEDDEEPQPTLIEQIEKVLVVLRFLKRHWAVLVVIPALAGAVGLGTVFAFPPPSTAEFELALTPNAAENPLEQQRGSQQGPYQFFADSQRAFADPRLVRTTLEAMKRPSDAGNVNALVANLELNPVRDNVYRGAMRDHDAAFAVEFLNKHLDTFLKSEIQKTLRVLQAEVDFLDARVKEKEEELRKTEKEMKEFKEKHLMHLPDFAEERLASLGSLEARRGELSTQVMRLEKELELAKQRLKRESPLVESKVAEARPYRDALTDANRRLAAARARGLGSEHPEVQSLEREVRELSQKADEASRSHSSDLDREANPEFTRLKDRVGDLQVELDSSRKELGEVGGQLGKIDETLKQMPEAEATFARLSRTYETDRALHGRLTERMRRAQIQLELERTRVQARYEVLTPAHSIGIDLRKTVTVRAGGAFGVGLLVAALIAIIRELRTLLSSMAPVQVTERRGKLKVLGPSRDRPSLPG